MIEATHIHSIAVRQGIESGIVEKDYVLSKVLMSLATVDAFRRTLIFKGGTALKKCFYPQWRFSEDLDFTSRAAMDKTAILSIFGSTIAVCVDLFGLPLRVIEYSQYPRKDGPLVSAQLKIGYDGPLRKSSGQKNNVRIDIAFDENILEIPQLRKVFNAYTDDVEAEVPVYSLEEIVAEKLRSILQRRKSRDYYDVWLLLTRHIEDFSHARVRDILYTKCAHRGLPAPALEHFLDPKRTDAAKAYWERGLAHQMTDLPPFEAVVNDLQGLLRGVIATE